MTTTAQRSNSLRLANEVKAKRREIVAEITCRKDAAEVIRQCTYDIPLVDIVNAIPHLAKDPLFDSLGLYRVSPWVTLGPVQSKGRRPITERERETAARVVGGEV